MTRSDAIAKSTRLKKLYRELLRLKPLQTLSKSNQWLESFSSGDDVRRTVAALAIDCRCSVAFRHKISEDPKAVGVVFTKLPLKDGERSALLSLLRPADDRDTP
jgi:hypothetical protein